MARLSRLKSQLDNKLALPNKYLGRTVWNSPQKGLACANCKWWAPSHPEVRYDPASQRSYDLLTKGRCGQLRIAAMFGGPPPVNSYYYCNYYERKEKDHGKGN
jgi:hypothetical protein